MPSKTFPIRSIKQIAMRIFLSYNNGDSQKLPPLSSASAKPTHNGLLAAEKVVVNPVLGSVPVHLGPLIGSHHVVRRDYSGRCMEDSNSFHEFNSS